jgi:hypothetical protein
VSQARQQQLLTICAAQEATGGEDAHMVHISRMVRAPTETHIAF